LEARLLPFTFRVTPPFRKLRRNALDRRSGSFTAATVLTLPVGIGLNAAIFTIIDCVLLKPFGYLDASRICSIDTRFFEEGRSIPSMGGDHYFDRAKGVHSLESTACYGRGQDDRQLNGHSL
jgi:hypothetical protein